jgi:hypothetical protein
MIAFQEFICFPKINLRKQQLQQSTHTPPIFVVRAGPS